MSAEEFRMGPDLLNEILAEAEVTGMRFTKKRRGPLRLDTDLPTAEVIDKLVSGMSLLYAKLLEARRG